MSTKKETKNLTPTSIAKDIEDYVFGKKQQKGFRAKAILKQIGSGESKDEQLNRQQLVSNAFFNECDQTASDIEKVLLNVTSKIDPSEGVDFLNRLDKIKESTEKGLEKGWVSKKEQLQKEIDLINERLNKKK